MTRAKIHSTLVRLPTLMTESAIAEWPEDWELVTVKSGYDKGLGSYLILYFIEKIQ